MKILTPCKLTDVLVRLGEELIKESDEKLYKLIELAQRHNAWFIPIYVRQAIVSIGEMLNRQDLEKWLLLNETNINFRADKDKTIGLVLAGNIPAVGFHDILCVLVLGHKALIKTSSQDRVLIPYILNKLIEIQPTFKKQIEYIDQLKNFDAVIATGSNNTSRYFKYYFQNIPHIIRNNRNSIAVLTGKESVAELQLLAQDVFDYFGLGCRNVSKLYVPIGYDFSIFFKAIEPFKWIGDHNKYRNNYDYYKAIFLVNREQHLDNGFLLLKSDARLQSPLATLYYEEYDNMESLEEKLQLNAEQIQCIVSVMPLKTNSQQVWFGESQKPQLWDYADGINTMLFLSRIV